VKKRKKGEVRPVPEQSVAAFYDFGAKKKKKGGGGGRGESAREKGKEEKRKNHHFERQLPGCADPREGKGGGGMPRGKGFG